MNFTGVYSDEQFYRHQKFDWVDCSNIQGVTYLCDLDAQRKIRGLIASYPPQGVHFIDSGNFHYISRFWTDKITEPFVLVVFDHHPDMQPTLFQHLMSCGCWVKDVLDTNPFVKKVVVVGAADSLIDKVPVGYSDKVLFFSESSVLEKSTWVQFANLYVPYPVYISIDKDVLSPENAVTNWDGGSMTIFQLRKLLEMIMRREEVIGIDVCGECAATLGMVADSNSILKNDACNKVILTVAKGANNLCG